jgi:hypothetical protein
MHLTHDEAITPNTENGSAYATRTPLAGREPNNVERGNASRWAELFVCQYSTGAKQTLYEIDYCTRFGMRTEPFYFTERTEAEAFFGVLCKQKRLTRAYPVDAA